MEKSPVKLVELYEIPLKQLRPAGSDGWQYGSQSWDVSNCILAILGS